MPLIIADRVRETTTTSGTGPISLAGPYSGFQAFSVIGNGNTTYYVIVDALNIAWEVGIGTYSSAGNTLARTTVLASSNAGSLVNFGVGPKDVMLTQPARRSVLVQQGGAGLLTGAAAFTANGIPYANSTSTLTTGPALTFDGATLINTAGTIAGVGLYSYATEGEGGQLSLANPTNTGTVASFDVVNATTARLFTTVNNAVLRIGQLAGTGGVVSLHTNSTERMRIDSAGNVGIGTSTPTSPLSIYNATAASVLLAGDSGTSFIAARSSNDATSANLNFRKYRGTTAAPLTVATGDVLGNSNYTGYDGSALIVAASITGVAEAVAGTGNLSGALTLSTRPAGVGASLTERVRIDGVGNLIQSAPTTPPTLATNGQMVFNLTSNTNLRVSVRGSDGVTRTANITLT